MSLDARIREQLMTSFRAELTEHVQTTTDGLLALEQGRVGGEERQSVLESIFRAAHSLKGAARAVGIADIEELAHALESVLDGIQRHVTSPNPALFTACFAALDAIQSVPLTGESEPASPDQVLAALAGLERLLQGTDLDNVAGPEESSPTAEVASLPSAETIAAAEPAPWTEGTGSRSEQPPTTLPVEDAATPPLKGAAHEPAAAGPAITGHVRDETVRVSVRKLDALMTHLSELLVTRIRAEQRLARIRQVQVSVAQWQKEWLSARGDYGLLSRRDSGSAAPGGSNQSLSRLLSYLGSSQNRMRELGASATDLAREYGDDVTHMSLVIDALEQEIKRLRMLPLSTITGSFARMLRDLAQEAGKEAALQIVGGDTEMDKRMLEQLSDPLIHLLRNAVDHGIEPPDRRVAAGKPRAGAVVLQAEQVGKEVIISVSDDGAGLDVEAIRQVTARRGGVDPASVTDADCIDAIFRPGVSTSPMITDISGRGVGLDVVRRNVGALNGRIDVDSVPGAGTRFTLVLPLTLTSARGLLVSVGNELFVVPLSAIERISLVSPQNVQQLEGQDMVLHDGRPVTLVRLDGVLELPRAVKESPETGLVVVVLTSGGRRMAFVVDELAGEQEIVMKGLGRPLVRVGGIAGATVMGDGRPVLVLNVVDLIKLAMAGPRRSSLERPDETSTERVRRQILVVDDSITTRTLEKNILEAAGYTVRLATDGQEALREIAAGVPDLIVADILMPRLDGIGLTRRVKADPRTNHVPVILVTSLDSPEDKARGIDAGADAYITKSTFGQDNLLATIQQLI